MFMGSVLKMFDGFVLVIKFSCVVHYLFFHKNVGAKVIGPFFKVMASDLLSSELYFFCTKGLMHESFFVPVHICVFLFLPAGRLDQWFVIWNRGDCFVVADLQEFVAAISELSHRMADSLLHGFATAHAAQIEPGEGINCCVFTDSTHWPIRILCV